MPEVSQVMDWLVMHTHRPDKARTGDGADGRGEEGAATYLVGGAQGRSFSPVHV